MKKVIVVGGGASGMMAAVTAASEGADVTVLEHKDRIGKKILSTGNGRCNFTNTEQRTEFYHCENPDFPEQVLEQFTHLDTIAFFNRLGIYCKNRNGYLYPYSDQASAILDVLRMELDRLGVQVETEAEIRWICKKDRLFRIETKEKTYSADRVILATGGKAAASTGSDGSGYKLARQLGHHLIPVVPALVQLKCRETFYPQVAGVRIQGCVAVYTEGKFQAADQGEIQLTKYGISGIPVFQVSRYAAKALAEHKRTEAVLDFMPDFSGKDFAAFLGRRIAEHPERKMRVFFTGLFPKKMAELFLKLALIKPTESAGRLSASDVERMVRSIKSFRTQITDTNGFENAQVCAGGVSTEEIRPETLESKKIKGLYFAGELLDVDGICGGYNLQWAWSSGYVAGKGAAK